MDSKRKANGSAAPETDDRSSKRRKLAEFDLSKGETRESTTAYGLSFLEQIRRTADKSGRPVATYFEELVPREGNADYYKQTRLPISLKIIEDKLNNGKFTTLAELESYFKRMIANAKEFYPRSSQVFDDAERVRKALSNYMTKTNPAYGNRAYQAMPTPLPPENGEEAEDEDDAEDDKGDEVEDEDAEGDEENDDAEGEDDQEDAEGDDDEEAEDEEDEEPSSRRRSIVLKRRGSGRQPRNSHQAQNSPRTSNPPSRPDHQYEGVPYKGLSFQQAQEKIVEELIRHEEPEYDDAYFEPFINLPPRALKDYYKIVTDPISLKKLQKIVKGVQGRGDPTGVSEFKTWAAFEEKSTLLWTNAYFYNEEDSEIYALAQELEKTFYKHFKEAQAAVPEPSQPKIKLKVGQAAEPPSSSKKITIHVGGRGGSADSPAGQAAQATETINGQEPDRGISGAPQSIQLVKTRSASVVASPSPSVQPTLKAEESARMSPAIPPQLPTPTLGQNAATTPKPPTPSLPPPQQQANPAVNGAVEQKRLRAAGKGIKDALISSLRIHAHPSIQTDSNLLVNVLPDRREMQQSATVNVPASHTRVLIVPTLPDFLHDRQYNFWALIDKQPLKMSHHQIPNQSPQERIFDVMLHPGVNVIEAHLISAIPRSERVQGEADAELEVFTVYINVMRP
ncbi:Chromatin structure-remodeling complex subunit rsc1 [Paramyrothecium foliicola]|nr:Chromatin structure-remodeling complex subunit rsc1 [Paramyrothecium foliicola]